MLRGPNIRDFTDSGNELPVLVDVSPVYETLLSLYQYGESCSDGEEHEAELSDSSFIERVRSRLSPELDAAIEAVDACWCLWLALLGVAHSRGVPQTVEGFAKYLAEVDPIALRRLFLDNAHVEADDEALDDLARGETDLLEDIVGDDLGGLRHVLAMEPTASRDHVVWMLERFHAEAMAPELEAHMPAMVRDADEKRLLALKLPPERVVEEATRGVTFELRPSISEIVLIPSVVIAPWTVATSHGSTLLFCYSLNEEQLNADPSAPPSYLVDLYKALGDERRLRLLSLLGEQDSDLKSLSQKMDLAKSTTHHHLLTLRKAGLVRVVLADDEKRYSLRKEGLAEAGPLLENYLSRLTDKED